MQSVHRLMSAAALALLSASAFASTTVYTSSASFLSNVAAGAYTNTFTGIAEDPPTTFSGGGFAYSIAADGGLYGVNDFLSTNQIDDALTINFTGNAVTALGGNFFSVDFVNAFQAVKMTVTLSDGTAVSFTPADLGSSYRGFTSTTAITSLVISAPGQSLYSSLDNFTVGTVAVPTVPEPGTWALMGLGLAGIAFAARRKA